MAWADPSVGTIERSINTLTWARVSRDDRAAKRAKVLTLGHRRCSESEWGEKYTAVCKALFLKKKMAVAGVRARFHEDQDKKTWEIL
jgi:hypothetical protein